MRNILATGGDVPQRSLPRLGIQLLLDLDRFPWLKWGEASAFKRQPRPRSSVAKSFFCIYSGAKSLQGQPITKFDVSSKIITGD